MIMTMLLRLIVVIIKRFPTKDCNGYFTLALTERHELNTAMDPCQVKRDPLDCIFRTVKKYWKLITADKPF